MTLPPECPHSWLKLLLCQILARITPVSPSAPEISILHGRLNIVRHRRNISHLARAAPDLNALYSIMKKRRGFLQRRSVVVHV
jgi:hypothetical protein